MKHLRLAFVFLSFIGAAVIAGTFYWVLPKTDLVQVSGTEVKRTDGPTQHDIRYVQALEDGTPRVYRNEDTRWGFPPYFKFNSSDISAKATEIARDTPSATVLVTYYGVRNHMLDWYPNIIRLEPVAADYQHIPIFNIAFLVIFWGIIIYAYVRARRGVRRIADRFKKKPPAA